MRKSAPLALGLAFLLWMGLAQARPKTRRQAARKRRGRSERNIGKDPERTRDPPRFRSAQRRAASDRARIMEKPYQFVTAIVAVIRRMPLSGTLCASQRVAGDDVSQDDGGRWARREARGRQKAGAGDGARQPGSTKSLPKPKQSGVLRSMPTARASKSPKSRRCAMSMRISAKSMGFGILDLTRSTVGHSPSPRVLPVFPNRLPWATPIFSPFVNHAAGVCQCRDLRPRIDSFRVEGLKHGEHYKIVLPRWLALGSRREALRKSADY